MKQVTKLPLGLRLVTLVALGLWMTLPVHAQEAAPEYVSFPDWPYFSEMVIVGNTIYLSGAVGIGPDFQVVPGGIGPETRQAMENIKASLAKADATMDDVVKCTVFLADMSDWVSMNEVYVTYFSEGRVPARSAVAVSDLAMHAKVEIECIAVRFRP
jgi:2-iminobutanoate/2-iminopropanoate deaminase